MVRFQPRPTTLFLPSLVARTKVKWYAPPEDAKWLDLAAREHLKKTWDWIDDDNITPARPSASLTSP